MKIPSRKTLQNYSKADLISMIECLDHNCKVANESFENLSKILKDACEESKQFKAYMDGLVDRVLEGR